MCGIVGVITREPVAASSLDAAAIACLGHRGPDGSGRWSDDHAGLGHARLAIIDLSEGGSQPMVSAGGRYVITFNGEIYNYVELAEELRGLGHRFESRCDTEVALAAFERWGPACVERFRGMFALAIWDTRERELFMARDRVGEKPLAVYRDGDRLVFASELKALIPLLPRSPELDPAAVDLYLHYQYWPEPWTPLEGVRRVPPAHTATLRVDDWRYEERRYWDLESCSPIGGDPAEAIRGALEESVRLTLRSDVPVGVALSGGIDSACVAALASAQYGGRLRAFSVGYPGRPPYDERAQARALAEKLGIEFEEVELDVDGFVDFFPELVRILDEPIADPAAFGHYAVPRAASEAGIKVLLTGIGGDELFWGYDWVRRAVALNRGEVREQIVPAVLCGPGVQRWVHRFAHSPRVPAAVRRRAARWIDSESGDRTPEGALRMITLSDDFNRAFGYGGRFYGDGMASVGEENAFRPMGRCPEDLGAVPGRVLASLFSTWLSGNCLALGDRVSMAVGVESRLPLLETGVIEAAMGLRAERPDHLQGHKGRLKAALRGVLDDEILDRPKRGFQPPVSDWLGGVLEKYGGRLAGGHLESAGVLRPGVGPEVLRAASDEGWPGLGMAYKLVLLETWCGEFLD